MPRIIAGCVLVAWSFLIIPANLNGPYATTGDLLFGYFVMVVGFFFLFSQVSKHKSGDTATAGAAHDNPADDASASRRIAEQVIAAVLAAGILALAKLILGA